MCWVNCISINVTRPEIVHLKTIKTLKNVEHLFELLFLPLSVKYNKTSMFGYIIMFLTKYSYNKTSSLKY